MIYLGFGAHYGAELLGYARPEANQFASYRFAIPAHYLEFPDILFESSLFGLGIND